MTSERRTTGGWIVALALLFVAAVGAFIVLSARN